MADVMPPSESAVPNRAARRAAARRTRRVGAVLTATSAAISGAAVLGTTTPAGAVTTWTVTNTSDVADGTCDADCSLRDALDEAEDDGDDSEIVFAASVTGTIQLTGGASSSLDLDNADGNTTITGPGASVLTVRGTDADSVFYADDSNVYELQISGLTVTNGRSDRGGGIEFYNNRSAEDPNLTLTGMVITGNHATSTDSGGGGVAFYGAGTIEITNSTISNNTSQGMGGGVFFYNSESMVVTNSVISGNSALYEGGGLVIYYDSGDDRGNLTITGSTISGNHTDDDGGGVAFYEGDALVITNSTFSGNTADENGGGLYIFGETAVISNSTFTDNHALYDGGGIAATGGDLTLQQTTISGNTAGELGDGLYLAGLRPAPPLRAGDLRAEQVIPREDPAKPPKVKAAKTEADAIGALEVGEVALTGTIISGNGADIEVGDEQTVDIASTSSLIGNVGAGITLTDVGGTIRSTSPGLAALASNGGPTQTMKLLTGSPALDTGPTTVPSFTGNAFDQRGTGHPRIVNGRVDIGAYEAELEGLFTG